MAEYTVYSSVHVLALLKGVVEGDPYKHFGSLLGIAQHRSAARRLGLLDDSGAATEAGISFYFAHHLATLPDGRANYWSTTIPDEWAAIEQALQERGW